MSCKCDTNHAGHFTLDAHASRPVACVFLDHTQLISPWTKWPPFHRQDFQMHFMNEKFCILIKISLKFSPKGPIDNNPALASIKA